MNKDNIIALIGRYKGIAQQSNINGMSFAGTQIRVETERKSGVQDEAIIIVPDELSIELGKIKTDVVVTLTGAVQTFKNFNTGKVLVYVLADMLKEIDGEYWQYENEVQITGRIAEGINHRETPKGKRITDLFIATPNLLKESSCYVPCICWNKTADEVAEWKKGQLVALSGRLQSRIYEKRIDEETIEKRTCYEVSINNIKKQIENSGAAENRTQL